MAENSFGNADYVRRNTEFVQLLKTHDRRLAAYIFSLVPDWNDAEDLIQNTCVKLWEQFDKYRPEEDFGTWACMIAHYEVMTYRKRACREKLQYSSEVVDALAIQAAIEHSSSELRLKALADCIRQLTESARKLLDLCFTKRMKVKNAAAQLGRSVNATYLMLSRVRRDLHDCVEATMKREDGR